MGYKEGNILFELNATKARFEAIFGTATEHRGMLYNYVKSGKSDVFIYYSGHGAPDPEKQHGMFTYYLLKGMRGEADSNKDGTITLAEMEAYVKEQVSTQARRMNREQEPMLTGQKERALVTY